MLFRTHRWSTPGRRGDDHGQETQKCLLGWKLVTARISRVRFFSKYVKTIVAQCYIPQQNKPKYKRTICFIAASNIKWKEHHHLTRFSWEISTHKWAQTMQDTNPTWGKKELEKATTTGGDLQTCVWRMDK